MEEQKNNAVEKVENIIAEKKGKTINNNMKMDKNSISLAKKERHERYMANRRIELAKIKAEKKSEREKAKALALREKMRKKTELQLKKQEIKEQRQKSKQERMMEKEKGRQKRKNDNRGFGGWLAAVITLSVATLVLASVLTFTFLMPTESDGMLEGAFKKSFYDTVEQVDNIDLNLSKILATSDKGAIQKYLVDTAINSELAENDLQQLPLQDESKFYTTKLINQIGDYAKYLNNKLVDGKGLNESDVNNIEKLYRANRTLKSALADMVEGMGDDFSFKTVMNGGAGNLIIGGFNDLQNLSVEYPELIYDGPFSDGQNNRELKGLKGASITFDQARDEFEKIFSEYSLEDVMEDGETLGTIECYNLSAMVKGENLYAQISKVGGKLVMFSYAGSCNDTVIGEDKAVEKGEEFLKGLGITGMKAVWINLTGNVYTINYALEQGGVIVYPDMIKVRVCAETSMVIGIEASAYYTNHTNRLINTPTLSESQAREKVSKSVSIKNSRLALVPYGNSAERLCYEFHGEYDGSTYYVYIDAINGAQVEMFKVVEGTEGTLLM